MDDGMRRGAFVEEAENLLAELESALDVLAGIPGDAELVGRACRALCALDESGRLFGFGDLSRAAGEARGAFCDARRGGGSVDGELLALGARSLERMRAALDGTA